MALVNPANQGLVNHFTRVGTMYQKVKNQVKAGTFFKVASLISSLEDKVDENYDIRKHPGCGPSTAKEISEYLKTGTSARLTELALNPEIPMENLQEKIARLLISRESTLVSKPIATDMILTVAMNGLTSSVDSFLENVDKFDKYLLDAGLEEVLKNLKENPNI